MLVYFRLEGIHKIRLVQTGMHQPAKSLNQNNRLKIDLIITFRRLTSLQPLPQPTRPFHQNPHQTSLSQIIVTLRINPQITQIVATMYL